MAVAATEIKDTLNLINLLWSEFQFTKEDFTRPESVNKFYSYFIAELNDRISFLINEEFCVDESEENPEFDKRVGFYCTVAKILTKLQSVPINLADFYFCNKKMYTLIKISAHFMIYIDNILDEVSGMVNKNINKQMKSENLKKLKQQFLEDNAENAENIARSLNTHEKLTALLEETKQLHEKMLADKTVENKLCSERESAREELQHGVDNLEYELKLLEDKENELTACVVTKEDFENLKETEKYLEIEQEQCDNLEMEHCIGTDIETVKTVEQHAKNLSLVSFEPLEVEILRELKNEIKSNRDVQKKLKEDLTVLSNTLLAEKSKLDGYERTLLKTKSFSIELQKNTAIEEENEKKSYQSKIAKCQRDFEKHQRVESEIISKQEDIKRTEKHEHMLNVSIAQAYGKILNSNAKVTETFYNILRNLKNNL